MAGRKPTQAAVREVYEEAGLIGVVSRGSEVGRYRYRKRLPTGKFVTCEVTVFLLRVRRELIEWPERDQRMRAWFSLDVAATLVAERALAKLILGAVSDKLMLLRSHIDNRVASRLNKIADAATEAIAALATDR
jgi:8-oxo-dGTP pyrophosphatase MutT (NUDIX family)